MEVLTGRSLTAQGCSQQIRRPQREGKGLSFRCVVDVNRSMPATTAIPRELTLGPFTSTRARELGISEKVLRGSRFTRLLPRVWVFVGHLMTHLDWIVAAELALPDRAQCSHVTRIQRLGLKHGPPTPLHFTIAGDHHLELPDVFLHRTEVLPPLDESGVAPAAAFIGLAASARLIDIIRVGDWLLHHRHMTTNEVVEVARRDMWRPGARQALAVVRHLDGRSRSLPESETRSVLVFAGLPVPEVNRELAADGRVVAIGDLVYLLWRLVVEYEGSHHHLDRRQWTGDIDRYSWFRENDLRYVQVTKEKLARPRALVSEVYRHLLVGGYDGAAPTFGPRFASLFAPVPASGRWAGVQT